MENKFKGKIIKIIGVVADVWFDSHLPMINELLRVSGSDVSLEVCALREL